MLAFSPEGVAPDAGAVTQMGVPNDERVDHPVLDRGSVPRRRWSPSPRCSRRPLRPIGVAMAGPGVHDPYKD